jgi:hypothetical protein
MERAIVSIRSDITGRAQIRTNLQDQIDRINTRLGRVERRLDIAD